MTPSAPLRVAANREYISPAFLIAILISLTIFILPTLALAQQPATREAIAPSATSQLRRPMLEELNHETEALYREVNASLVRVQLPQPKWMNDYAMAPMNRWDKLAPDVRKRLEQQRLPVQEQNFSNVRMTIRAAGAATQPAKQIAEPVKVDGQGTIIFVPNQALNNPESQQKRPRDAALGAKLQMDVNTVVQFTPNNVGLLLDDDGHVLVPLYIEREAVGDVAVRVSLGDGKVVTAKFIGSDRQTNLTLLQIAKSTGKPVQLSARKPVDGSLVLCVSTMDGSGRLGLWSGGQQDLGIIFTTDGGMAGIARYGQFLGGSACHLIAEQLIHFGAVRRATLGVIVSEIRKDDPLREQLPVLGSRTAMRINEVMAGSTAAKAGLKPGDVLLALAGESVSDIPSLAAAIAARTGATELQVLRGNEVLKITVDLQQQK
ncbi:MAG TPA: PDZ domain-containing protein [Humisphaera sp.]|nr:PDZ domain-containing protein [Humisphaera sp.]